MSTPDRFPVPVRSAVKSNLTSWCNQNLSNRALNILTVLASTTVLGRLFQILTMASVIWTNGRKYTENYWAERPDNIKSYTDERTL